MEVANVLIRGLRHMRCSFFSFLTGGRGFSPILGGSWLTENAEKVKVKEFLNGNEV